MDSVGKATYGTGMLVPVWQGKPNPQGLKIRRTEFEKEKWAIT